MKICLRKDKKTYIPDDMVDAIIRSSMESGTNTHTKGDEICEDSMLNFRNAETTGTDSDHILWMRL